MQHLSRILYFALALLLCFTPAATAAPPDKAGYIVVLHDSVESPGVAAREIARQFGGQVGYIYKHALKGFSVTLPEQAVAALQKNPKVKYVATDDIRYASSQSVPTGIRRIFADANPDIGINGSDDYRVDVDVAVIDTGVDFQHPDLNVAGGVNCTGSIFFAKCVTGGDDDHYHGTHVAGTIGALDNDIGVVGVAPGARIWAVKVLNKNGSGYSSWIIAGIDWVAQHADTIKVANMSLGGSGYSQAEYDAIQGAVNKGVAFAVAAGNEDDDANNYSPSAFDNVLVVSALADFNGLPGGGAAPTCRADVDDTLADFSNWGPQVDIAAPGVCILSTYPIEKGEYGTISGTSMASPHAAGALALLASKNSPGNAAAVYSLYNQVKNAGNYNWDGRFRRRHQGAAARREHLCANLDCRWRGKQPSQCHHHQPGRWHYICRGRSHFLRRHGFRQGRWHPHEQSGLDIQHKRINWYRWLFHQATQQGYTHHHRHRDRFRGSHGQRQLDRRCCCKQRDHPECECLQGKKHQVCRSDLERGCRRSECGCLPQRHQCCYNT